MNEKILIIEDDEKIANLLEEQLGHYGFITRCCQDFKRVIDTYGDFLPDLILLDVTLPAYDGYFWCQQLRQVTACPIIFTSARSDDMDQIHAISEGGDDYITKPYSFNVLIAKIQAQLRRAYGAYAAPNVSEIRFGDACFHPGRLTLQCQDTIQSLSKTEAAVVHSLFRHAPDVVTRESLLSTIWDDECFVEENTLNVTISRIRKRLDQISSVLQIVAVRGIGYRLAVPGDPKP